MAKSEVEKTETNQLPDEQYQGQQFPNAMGIDFDTLASESVSLPGHELADDALLDALVGVDFIITKVNFRKGLARRDDNMWKTKTGHGTGAYVSLEVKTNPAQSLVSINRARNACNMTPLVSLEGLGFNPGDEFVINDGSTGIYRQTVAILAMTGFIEIPDGPLEGKSGQTAFDTIPEEWPDISVGDVRFDSDGFATYSANVRVRAKRGIRVSEYESEFNPDSKTRYIA